MQTRQRTWTPMLLTQLLVVLAVLVAGVTGAGVLRGRDTGDSDDVLRVVSTASSSVAAQKTFRSTFSFTMEGAGLHVTSTGEMLIDTARNAQSGHVQAPGLGTLEMRVLDGVSYLRLPAAHPLPGGKHWVAMPSRSGAVSLGSQDPLETLKLLGGADDIRTVGEETVNGVRTTHYAVDIPRDRLADIAAQNPDAAAVPPGALDQIKDVTTDLWFDDQDLPRRMRMSLSVQQLSMKMAMEFLDYGKPVEVTAPEAEDVLRISGQGELGGLMQGAVRS